MKTQSSFVNINKNCLFESDKSYKIQQLYSKQTQLKKQKLDIMNKQPLNKIMPTRNIRCSSGIRIQFSLFISVKDRNNTLLTVI